MKNIVILLALLTAAATTNATAGCNYGSRFGLLDVPPNYILSGVTAAGIYIGSNHMSTSEAAQFAWIHSGSTVVRVEDKQMQACQFGSLCYAAGYSTEAWDAIYPTARGEWEVAAKDYPGFEPSTCRSSWFNVQNRPTASISGITGTRDPGESLTFSASGSRDSYSQGPLRYYWNFGDGHTAQGAIVTHSYGSGGTYTVKVRTYDGNFYSSWKSTSITISSDDGGDRFERCGPGTPYQCK